VLLSLIRISIISGHLGAKKNFGIGNFRSKWVFGGGSVDLKQYIAETSRIICKWVILLQVARARLTSSKALSFKEKNWTVTISFKDIATVYSFGKKSGYFSKWTLEFSRRINSRKWLIDLLRIIHNLFLDPGDLRQYWGNISKSYDFHLHKLSRTSEFISLKTNVARGILRKVFLFWYWKLAESAIVGIII